MTSIGLAPTGERSGVPALGGVGVLQLMCWNLVLIAVALALDESWPTIVAVAAAAVAVAALTAVRLRGRWLYEWLVFALRYRMRERGWDLSAAGETGRALLDRIAPEAVGVTSAGDPAVFMISRAEGITAVLLPASAAHDLTEAIPAPATLLPAHDEQAFAFAVQVVHHAGMNRTRPPRIWVAVQALRTAEVYRDADLGQALGNTVRRVQRRFRRDGLPARTLSEPEALGTLAALAHVNGGRSTVREQWRQWQSGPVEQAVFRLGGWGELAPAVATHLLGRLLTAAPQAAVTVAVTAHRTPVGTVPTVTALVRIAATSTAALDSAGVELTRLVRERGVDPERLDGRHAWGVAATLPLGVVTAR
ncbi:type VII secretion protein EccE [Dactylosporangium sp. NPDC049742]|uniref:type VII secretion protein EccE n=1 Tax=Dactylosporangium sp. NPDC049742 TaxID=3154737 RepID=UPI00343E2871